MVITTLPKDLRSVIHCDAVQQICQPLRQLNIHGFIFVRMFPDGTFIDLATHGDWSEVFFKNFYALNYRPEDIQDHIFLGQGVSLSAMNPQNIMWQEAKEDFNIGNAITLTTHHNCYTDLFYFYTDKNCHHMNEFYINNLSLLKQFSRYFVNRADNIILASQQSRFATPAFYQQKDAAPPTPDVEKFMAQISAQGIALGTPYNNKLSKKEINCLHWIIRGKTAEETSQIVNLSKRTVEHHINNIKHKLKANNLGKLIATLYELDLIAPIKHLQN